MNTPAHALLNLAILERDADKRDKRGAATSTAPWILVGALLPDVPEIALDAYHRIVGQSVPQMQSRWWELALAPFHSLPIIVALFGVALVTRSAGWLALSLSMLLHVVGDFLTHHSDAQRHLWPLSDLRWSSPVSYWDRAHHASLYVPCELAATVLASWIVWRHAPRRWRAFMIGAVNAWLCVAYLSGGAFRP